MRKLISALTALGMAVLVVDSASAQRTWTGGTGNWNTDGSWSGGVQPTSTDVVTFPSNGGIQYVVTINSVETCQAMDVHADCKIEIVTNGRLEVGSSDGQTSDVDGNIHLTSSGATLRFMNNHTIRPKTNNGSNVYLTGENSGAVIDDNPSSLKTLTLGLNGSAEYRIQGALQFQSLSMINDTLIDANLGGGQITLASSMTYDFSNSDGDLAVGPPSGTSYATLRIEEVMPCAFDFASRFVFRTYGTLDFGVSQSFSAAPPAPAASAVPYRVKVGNPSAAVTVNWLVTCP